MKRFEKTKGSPAFNIAIWLSTLAVFWADLLTPLGYTVWILYLVPLVLSLYEWHPRTPLFVAGASTALILAAILLSPGPAASSVGVARVNRSFGVLTIWAVALMVRQFITVKLNLRERDWIRSGQGELSARVRGEQTSGQLGDSILRFLCEYLEVPVAVLYAEESDGAFRRRAAYALGNSAALSETLVPGDGLLGQALKDKRIFRLDGLPQGYFSVSSQLGAAKPRHIVAVPAQVDGAVKGVLELGFQHPVGRSDMDLLAATSEPIAVALRSLQHRTRLEHLLAKTQRQAEELQAQQEELRVNNEELEEQSRALQDSQARLEGQQAELEQTNAQLEAQAQALEKQRDELSHAQGELVEKADALTRASQYKTEFLANMSHELRTPLNSALILAKLLADNKDGNLTSDQVKYAATIYSSSNDLLALINDILDLSRIEAGRMDLHVDSVDVPLLITSLERTFEPIAAQRGLSFEAVLAPGAPAQLTSDGLRIQQILRNLLSNAFKFTEAGWVRLRATGAPDERISFSVGDSGVGIAQDQHEVIFEAFRQADGAAGRRFGGTGLGLTISRELARRLGGDISLESAPGRGSTFTLTIPRVARPPAAAELAERRAAAARASPPPASLPVAAVSPRRAAASVAKPARPAVEDDRESRRAGERSILVVEDDPAFACILRDLAREQRFRALVAASAAEGIRLAEEFFPSAVLLDIHLPDDTGLAVLEHLKRNPETRHIPVHVVSVADYTQRALELGAIGYALKPVEREQLVEAIRKLESRIEQKVRQVLVVEDSAAQREGIVQLLKAENVAITSVATGAEALKQLQETPFDCMVLDLSLPDMSGYELLDKMAAGEAFSFPPVIVYTGRVLARDEEERLRRYASSIIVKGAKSPERLLDEVTLFLHQIEKNLSPEQQRILREVRNRESVLEGKSILIVDDDARNVFALASLLETKGAKPRFARNGKEALAALDAAAAPGRAGVDLVLMDTMMPEMDGLTATRKIRGRGGWKKLPIIALTAKAMPNDREECLRAGADDYIAKPLDVDRLLSLIKVWIPKGQEA
jgi:CheY-like chemotaxis protein